MSDTAIWDANVLKAQTALGYRLFPTEYLLRGLFSSRYFGKKLELPQGSTVLDIGCLYANNLVPFFDRGYRCYGVDVNDDMVEVARKYADLQKIAADIQVGTNRNLPFTDGFFDVMLSIVTIHYEDSRRLVLEGLREMARCLKDTGRLLISTVGPEHGILRNSTPIGDNAVRLRVDDFRDGQVFTVFLEEGELEGVLREAFGAVQMARVTERYPDYVLDFQIGLCESPRRG
jgi:SAM-dependent methyltransferase